MKQIESLDYISILTLDNVACICHFFGVPHQSTEMMNPQVLSFLEVAIEIDQHL